MNGHVTQLLFYPNKSSVEVLTRLKIFPVSFAAHLLVGPKASLMRKKGGLNRRNIF